MTQHWLTWAALAAVFAAATALLSKAGLKGVDPDSAQLVRTAVVLVAVGVLVAANGTWAGLSQWSGRTWLFLALSGLATAASWLCYFRALAAGDASRVAAVDKLSVVIIAVVAAIALNERLGLLGWLGVGLAVAGAALVSIAR